MHTKAQQSHIISAVNVVEGSLFIASFRKKDIQKVSHSLLRLFLRRNTSSLFSYNESGSKVTLILDKQSLSLFPRECLTVSHGWRGLEIALGECGYTESGVISQLTSALSEHQITIHYLSTYNTDYILVPEHQLSEAIDCFLQNFNIEIEVDDTRMTSSPVASCPGTPELSSSLYLPSLAVNMQGQAITPSKLSSSLSSSSSDLSSSPTSIKLITSPHSLCLASIDKDDAPLCMDAILNHIFFPTRSDEHYFFSFTETPNELSLILDQRDISDFPQISCMSRKLLVETYPWRAIKRAEKASQDETGFVNSVSKTLAAAKISLLYMSTHNSSVVLVRENNIQEAVNTLRTNGFEVMGNV